VLVEMIIGRDYGSLPPVRAPSALRIVTLSFFIIIVLFIVLVEITLGSIFIVVARRQNLQQTGTKAFPAGLL
jgi:heme/copper-type cytochrome/quinol oxidase subunit 2